MIIDRRLRLLRQWLLGRRNGVSFRELTAHLLAPVSLIKAQPFIASLQDEGALYRILFKDIERPLFFPKSAGLSALYQVTAEIFRPDDWHYYEAVPTALRPDDIVADCGAAEGLFSLVASKKAGQVYAIEPLPVFVDSLKKTFADFGNVEVIAAALGKVSGTAYLSEEGIMSEISPEPTSIKVELTTIDDLFFAQNRPLTYIKADLEGYEMEMLSGARATIEKYRPRVAITTYHRPEHAAEIEKFLKEIHPDYSVCTKGIEERAGAPVMLHAW